MALGNNNSAIYLSIADGKIVRRFKEPTSKTKERTITKGPNAGKVVYEEHYDFVEGTITDIQTKESDYGKTWNISMRDGSENFTLQMDYSGGYASAFLKALPNIDVNAKVKISPKMSIVDDKKKVTVFLNQNGQAAKHAYTKDNPNGLPQMVQKKVKGVLTWDDSDMMEFLENMVKEEILPKLNNPAAQPASIHEEEGRQEENDLPF